MQNNLDLYKNLSGKESVITAFIIRGMTQEQVADCFGVSRKTVNRHYKAAMKKLRKICLDK